MTTLWKNTNDGFATLTAEMDRLVNGLVRNPGAAPWSYGLSPAADVLETEAGYEVVLDLPGLDPAAVKIDLENDTLTVQADRKQPAAAQGATLHRSERSFGTFVRSFRLPRTVDSSRVEARYEHGVLTVKLPKREEAKPRTISVKVG
jgi:HSP20 family protein